MSEGAFRYNIKILNTNFCSSVLNIALFIWVDMMPDSYSVHQSFLVCVAFCFRALSGLHIDVLALKIFRMFSEVVVRRHDFRSCMSEAMTDWGITFSLILEVY